MHLVQRERTPVQSTAGCLIVRSDGITFEFRGSRSHDFGFIPENLSADLEVSPATVVHPNASVVITPTAAFSARRAAPLFQKLDSAARVGLAIMSMSVVGCARNYLALVIPSTVAITVPVAVLVTVSVLVPIPIMILTTPIHLCALQRQNLRGSRDLPKLPCDLCPSCSLHGKENCYAAAAAELGRAHRLNNNAVGHHWRSTKSFELNFADRQ